jgi:hypothetical protein
MDKLKDSILIGITFACMFSIGWVSNSIMLTEQYSQKYNMLEQVYQNESNVPEFLKIAQAVAIDDSCSETMDCKDYSQRLVQAEKDAGYEAKIVTGWLGKQAYCKVYDNATFAIPTSTLKNESECIGAHAWVEVTVPIEATNGQIIPMEFVK